MGNSFHSQCVAPAACMLVKENSLIRKQRKMAMLYIHIACICVYYCGVYTRWHITLEKSFTFTVNDYYQLKLNYNSNISMLYNLQIVVRTHLCHFIIPKFSITPCVLHLISTSVITLYHSLHINLSPPLPYQGSSLWGFSWSSFCHAGSCILC